MSTNVPHEPDADPPELSVRDFEPFIGLIFHMYPHMPDETFNWLTKQLTSLRGDEAIRWATCLYEVRI